tara:strand:- start:480 stop:680 length:201 start_codon:yes stop_codon:yes gene_type:complete
MESIELTKQEIKAVIGLIDIAIKHPQMGGGKIAGVGSFLIGKFQSILNTESPQEESEEENIEEVEE